MHRVVVIYGSTKSFLNQLIQSVLKIYMKKASTWQFDVFLVIFYPHNKLYFRSGNQFKVPEYLFKQNKNVFKIMKVLLYTYFCISLSPFNICSLPFSPSPNIGKIMLKIGPKTSYLFFFMSSCTNCSFQYFFSLMCSQPRNKQNHAHNFLLFKYYLNNLLLTVFMQNTRCNKISIAPC